MKIRVSRILISIFILEFVLVSNIYAQERGGMFRRPGFSRERGHKDWRAVYDQMNLTEEQRASLENNRKQNHEKMSQLREQIRSLRQELKQELLKPQLDEEKIKSLKVQLNEFQSQLTDLRLKGIMEVRDILTPTQYSIFTEMGE